ncbi:hypothetical protein [Orenia marismortui]|uniref:hypothetical protein n=1 Tax=Orenia marismortui TaxID=46469 RepID=UPI00036AFD87|nr:hypothetical protein [Orenia marismortui]
MVNSDELNLEGFKEQIEKTGFVLEYEVSKILENHGWNVITNRYYIDPMKNIDREIDILAYKVFKFKGIQYYTSLIISCKKSEKNVWSFLTKDLKEDDPNINHYPVAYWTNSKIIEFMLNEKEIENIIENDFLDKDYLHNIYSLNKEVFAFQQMNSTSCKPKNDSNIYNSITTTIKALEYERNSLPERRENKAFYNFNLLSIFKGDFIELYFNNGDIVPKKIDSIKYLNRHIVSEKEDFYRVHFISYDKLEEKLEDFNKLFNWNFKYYSQLISEYYNKVFIFDNYAELFWNQFKQELIDFINIEISWEYEDFENYSIKSFDYNYKKEDKKLLLLISFNNSKS